MAIRCLTEPQATRGRRRPEEDHQVHRGYWADGVERTKKIIQRKRVLIGLIDHECTKNERFYIFTLTVNRSNHSILHWQLGVQLFITFER